LFKETIQIADEEAVKNASVISVAIATDLARLAMLGCARCDGGLDNSCLECRYGPSKQLSNSQS
jgi:hypothetical protein